MSASRTTNTIPAWLILLIALKSAAAADESQSSEIRDGVIAGGVFALIIAVCAVMCWKFCCTGHRRIVPEAVDALEPGTRRAQRAVDRSQAALRRLEPPRAQSAPVFPTQPPLSIPPIHSSTHELTTQSGMRFFKPENGYQLPAQFQKVKPFIPPLRGLAEIARKYASEEESTASSIRSISMSS